MYPINVWFTWDPDKSDRNLAARGFDFEFASRMFDGVTLERQDDRREYGELRVVAVGKITDVSITLVYTDRSIAAGWIERRIISARVSSRKERTAYGKATQQDPD